MTGCEESEILGSDSNMPDTHLITGGAGNLACRISFELIQRGSQVVLMDVAERPVAPVAPGCKYVRGDLTDGQSLAATLAEHRPGVILHFASLLSGQSEQDRAAAWRVNMDGAFVLFEAALAAGVRQVFFPSSVAAYGGRLPNPLPEDFPQWPGGLYGVTKAAVERLGVYYHERHGLDFRSIRVPIVLSPTAPLGAASAYASRAFIEAVETGKFTFRVRPETRPSLIYIREVVRAILALLEAPAELLSRRVYNIHAMAPSAAELRAAIVARLPQARLDFDPDPQIVRLIESWPIEFDDRSARRDWGWQPHWNLDDLADDLIKELQRGSPAAPGL